MNKREDTAWREAATKYRKAKMALEDAQQDERDAKQVLLDLTEEDAAGFGVEVKFTERRGSVDYKGALQSIDPKFDVEPFRKASASVTNVKIDKE